MDVEWGRWTCARNNPKSSLSILKGRVSGLYKTVIENVFYLVWIPGYGFGYDESKMIFRCPNEDTNAQAIRYESGLYYKYLFGIYKLIDGM